MTRQVGRATWSPDGKSVAFISNMSGRNNVWVVPAEGGWPVQLTVSDQRQTAPAWSPDGKWIAYQSDYDGDEQWDIFLVSPKTGKVVNLTQTREIAEMNPTWSPDGALPGVRSKAENLRRLRDRCLRHGDARGEAHHHEHAAGSKEITASSGRKMGNPSSTRRSKRRGRTRISSSRMSRQERARCSRRMKASSDY